MHSGECSSTLDHKIFELCLNSVSHHLSLWSRTKLKQQQILWNPDISIIALPHIANFIVLFSLVILLGAAEVSYKHYLAVSLALATGSMQLQQFQESVGSQHSLGWLPVLSSNMRGLTSYSLGCPRFAGASFVSTCTLLPDSPHTAGYTPTRRRLRHSRVGERGREIPVSSSCRQPGTAKIQTHSFRWIYSVGFTRDWVDKDIW